MMKRGLAVLVAIVSLGVGAAPASAEWFADVFAGLSFTRDHDVKLNDVGIGLPPDLEELLARVQPVLAGG